MAELIARSVAKSKWQKQSASRPAPPPSSAGHEAWGQPAQSLLHARRDRPLGHVGGQLRAGIYRPRSLSL